MLTSKALPLPSPQSSATDLFCVVSHRYVKRSNSPCVFFQGYRCCCPKGYTGKTCNLIQKPCSPNPCEHNGTCVEMDDKYQCSCPEGFTGENCEVKVDDCLSNPCQNGGTCIGGIASFTCTCLGLYTGQRCESGRPSYLTRTF